MNPLDEILGQIKHQPIRGGCDRCDAYQTVESRGPSLTVIRIHHDDWCPFLRAREAGAN